jgi:branched-chain amino acid transport system substrate-binding protein
MPTYLFKVDDTHSLQLIESLGVNEPTFLTDVGVDMRKNAPGRQFLPPDNPKWKDFFQKD